MVVAPVYVLFEFSTRVPGKELFVRPKGPEMIELIMPVSVPTTWMIALESVRLIGPVKVTLLRLSVPASVIGSASLSAELVTFRVHR